MKLKPIRDLRFDIDKVKAHFEGEISYLGDIFVNNEMWAFFSNRKPNLEKGHKYIFMLTLRNNNVIVSGMDLEEFEKIRFHNGKLCEDCNDVIYSLHRHDMRYCSCGSVFVDGGTDYMRTSLTGLPVSIDYLRGEYNVKEG